MSEVATESRRMDRSAIDALRVYNEQESPRAAADLEVEALMKSRMFSLPAELIQAPFVVVCSVWPERLTSQAFTHGGAGIKRYKIEPGSPEKPSYLPIQNTYDLIQQPESLTGPLGHRPATILASQIAVDLIQYWTGDHPGNRRGKKGVGVIKGTRTETGSIVATPDEIVQLVKMQHDFLSFLVERADEYWDIGKREKVTNEHRKALKMLGLDIGQHPWYRSKVQLYNTCPRCAEKILVEANFCKHCRTDLVEFFMDENVVPDGEIWPSVVRAIERKTAKTAKKAS